MEESAVIRAIRGFKAQLRAREGAQVRILAERYLDVERALEANIAALSEQIARLVAAGEEPSRSQLYRLDRYQRLQAQITDELVRFNGWAADIIREEQLSLMEQGIDDAAAALETAKPGLAQFVHRVPSEAIRGMVGLAADGSPLSVLLSASGAAVREALMRELIRSVALGRNPKVTAAAMRKATGIGLQRALTIARTEQLRVYREASLESYRNAGVTKYMRISARDSAVCIACLSQDGEVYSTEVSVDDHPQGRCDAIPCPEGVALPTQEPAQAWFDRQPADVQRTIMGPGRLAAYRSGDAPWSELAMHRSDPVWGGAWVPTPLSDLSARAVA